MKSIHCVFNSTAMPDIVGESGTFSMYNVYTAMLDTPSFQNPLGWDIVTVGDYLILPFTDGEVVYKITEEPPNDFEHEGFLVKLKGIV